MSTSISPTKIPRRRGIYEMWEAIGLNRKSKSHNRMKVSKDILKVNNITDQMICSRPISVI